MEDGTQNTVKEIHNNIHSENKYIFSGGGGGSGAVVVEMMMMKKILNLMMYNSLSLSLTDAFSKKCVQELPSFSLVFCFFPHNFFTIYFPSLQAFSKFSLFFISIIVERERAGEKGEVYLEKSFVLTSLQNGVYQVRQRQKGKRSISSFFFGKKTLFTLEPHHHHYHRHSFLCVHHRH